jgi:hypothetical protein
MLQPLNHCGIYWPFNGLHQERQRTWPGESAPLDAEDLVEWRTAMPGIVVAYKTTCTMFKPTSLLPVLIVASLVFVMDALIVNVAFFSLLVGIFQVVVGLPLLFLTQDGRRQRLRNIGIFLGVLLMVVVMVNVNAYTAPLHADRLIEAIESYRAATGVYPKKLDDLVPKFIDHVPYAQYTIGGNFWYTGGGTAELPMLWYNPHGMDHRIYHFKTKDWGYVG